MSRIQIQLFGRFCVRYDEQIVAGFEARKLQELFGYLLLHRHHPLSREVLAGLFWPDDTIAQSKKKLRQLLWHLQSALGSLAEAPHDRLLRVEPDQVQMNTEADFWLDIAVFEKTFAYVEQIAGPALDSRHVQALHHTVQLYHGSLLEGCYENWCLSQREHFQNMYLTMLEKLMSYCEAHRDYDAGILYGMRSINCDRLRERVYRRLMRLHYLNGDRAAALRLYEQCAVALDEELGVKVSNRTKALYEQILADQQVTPMPTLLLPEARPTLNRSTPSLSEVLDYLTGLQELLTDLQSQVQQSLQQVERALNKNPAPFSSTKIDAGNDAPETLRKRY